MAVRNRFNWKGDVGFVRSIDAASARRQFKISLTLVFILAVSVLALGTMIQFDAASNAAQLYDLRFDPDHAAILRADS